MTERPGRVAGKTALVTGAGTGLGRAAALRLAEEGATVVVTDVDETGGQETVALIQNAGGAGWFHSHDVTAEPHWNAVITETIKRHDRLDILVNNAGIIIMKPVDEMTLGEFQKQFSVNVDGVFLGLKYGVQAMKRTGAGSIINLSSVAGLRGTPRGVAYCGSKGAVRLMTKAVAQEMREQGLNIRVNSIHPALIDTAMAVSVANQMGAGNDVGAMVAQFQGRLGTPREVADGILYLASDEASFTTAAELMVDGGTTG